MVRKPRPTDVRITGALPTIDRYGARCCILVDPQGVHMDVEGSNADFTVWENVRTPYTLLFNP